MTDLVDDKDMAVAFTVLRSNDLIWPYVEKNYWLDLFTGGE